MVHHVLDKMKLALGRLLGQGKRKEKDIVQMWQDFCNAQGWKPTDRLIDLLSFDLSNNGVDLTAIKVSKQNEEIDEAFNYAELSRKIAGMSSDFTQQVIALNRQHADEIMQLKQLSKLQNPEDKSETSRKPTKEEVLRSKIFGR